jgi:mannose-6-phosphate isomerase-like protein (cupin superfamily)
MKYSKYIVTEPKPVPPEIRAKFEADRRDRKPTIESIHLLSVDSEIIPDMFYVDCVWLWKGTSEEKVEGAHVHDFDEVIAFIGSNRDKPQDLGGQITIWLDGEKHVLDKTCLIFVPAGASHCPIIFNRIDTPVFFATISPSTKYTRADAVESKSTSPAPRCRVVTEVVEFQGGATGKPPTPPPDSTVKGARVMHLEDHVAEGSFYVDFVWIYEGTGAAPAPEHNHDWEEVIAMIGADQQHPNDLGGTMSIVLGDETHYINKSSLVCIPKGLKHCPWKFLDIKKPTLVFTAGPSGKYTGSHRQPE